ncbi:MAG: HAD family hydrolase [Lachnospiraceae bacterium]|nr:HAD family hydrolase [Lachnospiraceae bacterium]
MKSLYIFDMDGTILYTLDDITNAVNYVLDKYSFPKRTVEEVRFFVGNGLRKTLERSVSEGTSQETIDAIYPELTEYYKEHANRFTRPYDGIVDVIKELRERGMKTAVVSNKRDEAVKKLCDKYFDGCFDMAMGDREGIALKPAPDMVNMVINAMGVTKDECLYIGDSDVDLLTAENSGIDCIGVAWGFRGKRFLEEHGAETIIEKPEELLHTFMNFDRI